jgi:aminopeptidase
VIDPDRFAALLCDWCLGIGDGDQALVTTTTLAEPLVLALQRALLARGAWPLLRLTPPEWAAGFYAHAGAIQIDGFAPLELLEIEQVDAVLSIMAPANTRALAGIDPTLIARAGRARAPIQERRLAKRWCGTQWATPALAQQAAMGEAEYERFLTGALFLDQPDPIAAWQVLSVRQQRLVNRLAHAEEVRIESEGTDLRLRVGGRTWVNSDGRHNMPSGEVFTGPHERSAQGTIRFTVPSSPRGVEVADVELGFRDGEVVSARAERGDGYLQAALDSDAGARFLGELGIGTNAGIDRATGSILLDEKMAGTVHLALGRSYPQTGGENESALHWDLICDLRDGGRLSADGDPIVESGRIVE